MQTDLVTVVFTDLKDYSHYTAHHSHEDNARLLGEVGQIITPMVHSFGGRLVKSIGDGHMIIFKMPSTALECAMAILDYLYQRNEVAKEAPPLHLRIAMALGEVRLSHGDVFGDAVNYAARLESLTPADDIYLTSAVYGAINRSEYPCRKVGDFHLTATGEAIGVYRLHRRYHVETRTTLAGAPKDSEPTGKIQVDLPYGGRNLRMFLRRRLARRLRWAILYIALGVGSALAYTYLYRPNVLEMALTEQLRFALIARQPQALLTALQAWQRSLGVAENFSYESLRREQQDFILYWLGQAIELLLELGHGDEALQRIEALKRDFPESPLPPLLRGLWLAQYHRQEKRQMLDAFAAAFMRDGKLAERQDVIDNVMSAYFDVQVASYADSLVGDYLKDKAIAALQRLLLNRTLEQSTRWLIANRLSKLGAADSVDFGSLAIDDLVSASCDRRKKAIVYLLQNNDDRAVGPLMRLAASKHCGALEARLAASSLVEFYQLPSSQGESHE